MDHNNNTIDGHSNFHGMGLIASVTHVKEVSMHVPRVEVSYADVQAAEIVDIHKLPFPCLGLIELMYNSLLIRDYKKDPENEALALERLHDVKLSLTNPHPSW